MSRLARIYSKEQENPPDMEQIGMLAGLSNYRKVYTQGSSHETSIDILQLSRDLAPTSS
jgi:hypothetical protein